LKPRRSDDDVLAITLQCISHHQLNSTHPIHSLLSTHILPTVFQRHPQCPAAQASSIRPSCRAGDIGSTMPLTLRHGTTSRLPERSHGALVFLDVFHLLTSVRTVSPKLPRGFPIIWHYLKIYNHSKRLNWALRCSLKLTLTRVVIPPVARRTGKPIDTPTVPTCMATSNADTPTRLPDMLLQSEKSNVVSQQYGGAPEQMVMDASAQPAPTGAQPQ
jgi:hypothetical protein